jgi:hypothetical protein
MRKTKQTRPTREEVLKDAEARVRSMTTEKQVHLLLTVLELLPNESPLRARIQAAFAKSSWLEDNSVDPKSMSEAEKDAVISDGDALLNEITELAIAAWGLVQ